MARRASVARDGSFDEPEEGEAGTAHPEVQLIGIDTQDSSSGAKSFYRRWGWRHPSIADPQGELAARLALQGTPTTFFLNARHQVVTQIVGATNLAGFNQGLAAATSGS